MSVTETAATELFAQHHAPLLRYLARYTGDPDVAADIAQESFVRLLEHAPPDDFVKPWLYRVATNLARDASRTASRRRRLVQQGRALLTHSDPPPSPDSGVNRDTARSVLRVALDALSPKERIAVLMREEGFAHREIAEAIGTTTGSVGTLLARSLRKTADAIRAGTETI